MSSDCLQRSFHGSAMTLTAGDVGKSFFCYFSKLLGDDVVDLLQHCRRCGTCTSLSSSTVCRALRPPPRLASFERPPLGMWGQPSHVSTVAQMIRELHTEYAAGKHPDPAIDLDVLLPDSNREVRGVLRVPHPLTGLARCARTTASTGALSVSSRRCVTSGPVGHTSP